MYKVVCNGNDVANFYVDIQEDIVKDEKICAIDTETDSLNIFAATWLLLQVKINSKTYLFDIRKLSKDQIKYVVGLLKDNGFLFIGHNIKFDIKVIYHNTGELLTNVYDTMIGEILTYNGNGNQYPSLKLLVTKYSGITIDKTTRDTFADIGDKPLTEEQLVYSSLDVEYLKFIYNSQIKTLDGQKQLPVMQLEMDILPAITMMEYTGVHIDKKQWNNIFEMAVAKKEESRLLLLEHIYNNLDTDKFNSGLDFMNFLKVPVKSKKAMEMLSFAGKEVFKSLFFENFNVNSYAQMLVILKEFGLPVESTNEKIIKDFASDFPIVKLLLDYKEFEKKVSTYGDSFLESNLNPVTGKVHSDFNQLGTATGRFSSSNVNLQNVPREKEYRKAFIAPQGYKIITADYSQAELRLLAEISSDKEMIDAFINGIDLHSKSAAKMFNIPVEDVTKEQRHHGKTFNFGVVYGISEYGLSKNLGIPIDTGKEMLEKYFDLFKTLSQFIKYAGDMVVKLKYSTTPFGRKRFFEDKILFIDSKDMNKYFGKLKREGVNHIIQGGIADVVKFAMKFIFYENPFGNDLVMIMQVHDEIVFLVKEEIAEDAQKFIVKQMIRAGELFIKRLPVEVDSFIEDYWTKG